MKREFPDLIKAGLKEGDEIHSWFYGKGEIRGINLTHRLSIHVLFDSGVNTFLDNRGFVENKLLVPIIHLDPWNPVAGEPFPFPSFEPLRGETYAFWNDNLRYFIVAKFDKNIGEKYYPNCSMVLGFQNCAPIEEAMHIFGFNDKGGEGL